MASGSDAGTPGEHLGPSSSTPRSGACSRRLERDVGNPRTDAPEDSECRRPRRRGRGPLPAHGGQQDDGLSVVFDPPPDL